MLKLKIYFLVVVRLFRIIKRKFWTALVKKTCKKYGTNLNVNASSRIGRNVTLGENCNFNGMRISGGGDVYIGNNFHSAGGCEIFAQYHNYDKGKAIPYDDSLIKKTVTIEDNVWLGYHVIILGTAHIGEGAIIQARCKNQRSSNPTGLFCPKIDREEHPCK